MPSFQSERKYPGGLDFFSSFHFGPSPAEACNCQTHAVTCEIKVISRHERLVTFSWNAKVFSDKKWDACDLIISFQDRRGREVYTVKETLRLNPGNSQFSGEDICERRIWDQMEKYVVTLDCVFE